MPIKEYFELYTAAWEYFKKYRTAKPTPDLQEQAWKEINVLYKKFSATKNDLADAILEATYNELDRLVFSPMEVVAVGRAS